MSEQPEALRLADALTKHLGGNTAAQAAAELRRLHQSEREGWRYAAELEQTRKELMEALKWIDSRCPVMLMEHPLHGIHKEMAHDAGACARAAIAKAEGETK